MIKPVQVWNNFFQGMITASASFAAISLGVGIFEGKLSGLILSGLFIIGMLLFAIARSIK